MNKKAKRDCCKVPKGTTAVYQPSGGVDNVLVVLRCPGKGEEALCHPAAGATGVHLCRIFHRMKSCTLCIRSVAIVNVATRYIKSTNKVSEHEIDKNSDLRRCLLEYVDKENGVVILCGEDAVRAYEQVVGYREVSCAVVKMCHMSQCGINHLTCASKNMDDDNWRYDALAMLLDYAMENPGKYGLDRISALNHDVTIRWSGDVFPLWLKFDR